MRLRILTILIFMVRPYILAQVTVFPFVENFDGVVAPSLPAGWSTIGFSISASAAFSSPNCLSAVGNTSTKQITSPVINFSNKSPQKLVFFERRSNTAAGYRLEVWASTDGSSFNILLARFDTIPTTSAYVQRIVSLEDAGLHQQSNVRFRWQLPGDNTNTTGVLRIDDVSISVAAGVDIGFSRFASTPVQWTRKDSVMLTAVIKNYGSFPSSDFSVRFSSDDNGNGFSEPGEQFSILKDISLAAGDSSTYSIPHAPMKPGQHRFIARIDCSTDENPANDTARVSIIVGNAIGDILINEILYYPTGDEPEWVELLNTTPDTINLKDWRISDSNSSSKSAIASGDVSVAPASFIVIAKDAAFSSYHPEISFLVTSFSALNNSSPDAVVIYDPRLKIIDSVQYAPSWGGQNGKSLERIDTEIQSTLASNWSTCQDSLGSTPGRKNSIARADYDVVIRSLVPLSTTAAGKIVPGVAAGIQNIGRMIADSVLINFYTDRSGNGIPEPSELLSALPPVTGLAPGDSILLTELFPQLSSGGTTIIAQCNWRRDENLRNNRASVSLSLSYDPRSIIINEIMYDPLQGQNEWLEVFNRSSQPIDLAHWKFNDRPTLNSMNVFEIPGRSFVINSGDYAVLAADSSFVKFFQNLALPDSTIHVCILNHSSGFSLNNDGDAVVLKDITGLTIDSVAYFPGWHNPDVVDTRGRSLERINPNIDSNDPRNWSTCTNILGGTPGKRNSIITAGEKRGSLISISPNPFSPDGDGFEDFCIIRYTLPLTTSILNIRIYDIKGRLIRTLANGELAGSQGDIVWNGLDDNKQRARIGVYIIFLEATDRSSGTVVTAKAVAVVAAKL